MLPSCETESKRIVWTVSDLGQHQGIYLDTGVVHGQESNQVGELVEQVHLERTGARLPGHPVEDVSLQW